MQNKQASKPSSCAYLPAVQSLQGSVALPTTFADFPTGHGVQSAFFSLKNKKTRRRKEKKNLSVVSKIIIFKSYKKNVTYREELEDHLPAKHP